MVNELCSLRRSRGLRGVTDPKLATWPPILTVICCNNWAICQVLVPAQPAQLVAAGARIRSRRSTSCEARRSKAPASWRASRRQADMIVASDALTAEAGPDAEGGPPPPDKTGEGGVGKRG